MYLIDVVTKRLLRFVDYIPYYVALSHTWGNAVEEPTFQDVLKGNVQKSGVGAEKFHMSCEMVRMHGFPYAWIDTCCINKDDPEELREGFGSSRWFTRGWMLQELLAPRNVIFYNSDSV
ncbi:hypothetical protein MAPG_05666 [Magnaporthiopsis poae ATCC 64411]|uniref:Heterokaryon incompatibility domain-containing protein n=1 Tax=Magnaporthiopsis poae (strain ATCC 64411 / 73-15) TaxID=644358 RepID=A0A0C4E002_MAGP6|nr:hypothetical protein MAPG_05666 [Magnaporthiopsis poae ATCC 64411]